MLTNIDKKTSIFKKYTVGYSWIIFRAILIGGISFIIIFPLLNQLSLSFMSTDDLINPQVNFIPSGLNWYNYQLALEKMNYYIVIFNSIFFAAAMSLLQLLTSIIIGYGFARFKFKGSNILFGLVLLTLIIPPSVIMVPLYLNFRYFTIYGLLEEPGLNLLGTTWPLLMMAATGVAYRSGLFIYITRQYFKGIPITLEEAAYIDGAGPLKTFFKIMVPNATPILLIIFLFSFVWQYNDLFFTELLMGGGQLLSLTLSRMVSTYLGEGGHAILGYRIAHTHISFVSGAAMLLYLLPLLILYTFLQKYFVESIERTGIVG